RALGTARGDGAVAGAARADVSQDREGGGAASPSLADVWAARLLADRVQAAVAHDPLQLGKAGVARRGAHLHPGGPFAGELGVGHQTAAGSGSNAIWNRSWKASRRAGRRSSTVTARRASTDTDVKSAPRKPQASNSS